MVVPLRARGATPGRGRASSGATGAGALRRRTTCCSPRRSPPGPPSAIDNARRYTRERTHRPDPAAQPAARSGCRARQAVGGGLPLPARREPARRRRRLVRRHPAVRRPGRPGRRRRRRPRHPRLGHHGPAAHRRAHPRRRRPAARRAARPTSTTWSSASTGRAGRRRRALQPTGESAPPACTPSTTRSPAAAPWPAPAIRRPPWSRPGRRRPTSRTCPPGPPLGLGGLPFEAVELSCPRAACSPSTPTAWSRPRPRHRRGLDATCAGPGRTPAAVPGGPVRHGAATPCCPPARADDVALLLARTHALGADQVADLGRSPTRPRGRSPRTRKLAVEQLAAWGLDDAGLHHRTGRQRAGHQRHPLRRAARSSCG